MKLSSFLSQSRHGIYYFRWPLSAPPSQARSSIRISLKTRCPHEAGDLARFLASCGRLTQENRALARLRQDEIRTIMQRYFKSALDRYTERLNDTGLSERHLPAFRHEIDIHQDDLETFGSRDIGEISEQYLEKPIKDLLSSALLSDEQWSENERPLLFEMRKGRRDLLRAILSTAEGLDRYDLNSPLPNHIDAPHGATPVGLTPPRNGHC
ncbi:hypothetical protein [Celeribacter halophilus]|uniref:hypothetical protein n=1 Tax=Celeribacter halophilus TaxID=576117 RepID=UPI003A8EF39C